jgi:hypothetical protein
LTKYGQSLIETHAGVLSVRAWLRKLKTVSNSGLSGTTINR